MKIKLYKSVALCSLLALAGCHDFEELNTNPYAPIYDPTVENVSADGIDIDYTLTEHAMASLKGMEGAIGSIFANFTYEGPYNDYQTTTNLTYTIIINRQITEKINLTSARKDKYGISYY